MKICFLGDAQSIHLQRWANYFIENDHNVHIITTKPKQIKGAKMHDISFFNKEDPKARVIGFFIYKYREYKSILTLKKLLDKIKPDILNAHYMTFYGMIGSKLNFHPYIITCWGSDVLLVPNILGETYVKRMKKALRKADLIVVVSEYMKKKLIKIGIKKNIMVNPLGIKISKFNPNSKKNKLIKEKFDNKKIIISTRNLEPIYNVECLIKALPSVVKENENIVTLICGNGSLENELKKLVNDLELNEYVYFLGGISHEKMPDYLRAADFYVSTSISDGISISLLEAMGCGLIPIVSDIPANHEVIKDFENGFIFKNNPVDLCKKIIYCIKNHDEIKEGITESNFKKIKNQYNWEKNISHISNLHENFL